MSFKKNVLVVTCLAALSVAIPQERIFAQADGTQQWQQEDLSRQRQQEDLLRQRQQEDLLRQRQQEDLFRQRQEPWQMEPQLRPNVTWNIKIVHAHTFEKIYRVTLTARNVTGPEEAKWDIRSQLGFPMNSDQRTAGGVPQLIIWFEISEYAQAAPVLMPPPPPPDAPFVIPQPPVTPRPARVVEARPRVNWLSVEGSIAGGGIRYERDLNNVFTLGGTAWLDYNFFARPAFGAMVTSRLFLGRVFYVELGLGLGTVEWEEYYHWQEQYLHQWHDGWQWREEWRWRQRSGRQWTSTFGPMIAPAIGLRLGGQTRGFFANPYISLPLVLGAPVLVRAGIGLGWAW